jgi:hypothetical protein
MPKRATEPGDLVLVKSGGLIYRVGRRITGNGYDHVAVVGHDGHTLNIVKPVGKLVPTEKLLAKESLVLRPAWRKPGDRDAFVAWVASRMTSRYDTARTFSLIAKLILRNVSGLHLPLREAHAGQERWICTDAILIGLHAHTDFEAVRDLAIDWNKLKAGTTNDFVVISEMLPDVLARVS